MSTLETIEQDSKNKKFKELALNIIKYQKFSNKYIVEQVKDYFTSEHTLIAYITSGLSYLNTGKKSKNTSNKLYNYINEYKSKCVQPLTPSFEQRRQIKKIDYTKKENIPNIAKIELLKKPITKKIEYGVRINNDIKILKNEELANIFLDGVKFANKEVEAKVITIEVI